MKKITLHVRDVVKLRRGDEVIIVKYDKDKTGRKISLGVDASQDWRIDLVPAPNPKLQRFQDDQA